MADDRDRALQKLGARIDTLEMRIAYQDDVIEQLNTVIVEQWNKLDQMRGLIDRLESRLLDAQAGSAQNPYDEPPPPHY